MALTVVGIQESHVLLGLGLMQRSYLAVPGTSDYVTGGYAITTTLTGFLKLQTAWISGSNSTASPASGGWYAECVFPIAQFGAVATGAGFDGYAQFLLKVYVASTGVELASGGNLTGAIWAFTCQGF
ncbi:MAG TPA: hypothetical protein VN861_03205 [Candidatus Acidoferrales bacterium]|nr:hypothetical protein [Candidatus Acidoferrales bacterium]